MPMKMPDTTTIASDNTPTEYSCLSNSDRRLSSSLRPNRALTRNTLARPSAASTLRPASPSRRILSSTERLRIDTSQQVIGKCRCGKMEGHRAVRGALHELVNTRVVRLHQFGRRALPQHLAVANDIDVVGNARRFGKVVRNHDTGD